MYLGGCLSATLVSRGAVISLSPRCGPAVHDVAAVKRHAAHMSAWSDSAGQV